MIYLIIGLSIIAWIIQTILAFMLGILLISFTYAWEEHRFLKIIFGRLKYDPLENEIKIITIISFLPIINIIVAIAYFLSEAFANNFQFKEKESNPNFLIRICRKLLHVSFLKNIIAEEV